jgi:hypothetical protein
VALDSPPLRLAASPDGSSIYVATEKGHILRVDPRTHAVETVARGIDQLRDLAVTGDGRKLYATALFKGLRVIDLGTRELRDVRCPVHLATMTGKDLLYVSYQCGSPGGRSIQDLRIGGPFGSGGYFSGVLDEIQMFNRALTAGDVKTLHASGRWGTCVG